MTANPRPSPTRGRGSPPRIRSDASPKHIAIAPAPIATRSAPRNGAPINASTTPRATIVSAKHAGPAIPPRGRATAAMAPTIASAANA